jgi:hypothetical protein
VEGLVEGRNVHYVAYNGRHLAAIVIGVNPEKEGQVNLSVFTDMRNVNGDVSGGIQFHFNVPYSEEPKSGHWHWIERA